MWYWYAAAFIAGGSEHGGTNPFDAVGLQSLYDLSDKMAK